MNRRDAVYALLALGAAISPLRVAAQATKGEKPFRIVTLSDLFPDHRGWFSDAMRDLGWIEERDFVIVESGVQWGQFELHDAVNRIVVDKPDLVLTFSTAYALAVHRAVATIPIVMWTSGYPVEAGVADSLARPGRNVTGNTAYAGTEIWGKLLQLLRDVKPAVKRISVLWTYVPPKFPRAEIEPCYAELRHAERSLDLKVHIVEAENDQVPGALAEIDGAMPGALLVTSGLALSQRSTVMQFAVRRRLPTITDGSWPATVEPHPLLAYSPNVPELFRSAAAYVDKVLKGAKPGDLPIQQPAKFQMVVNLRTAKAIGLAIPHDLLLRADRVIE
jgi:putative ABC transport system substrate-binding protein